VPFILSRILLAKKKEEKKKLVFATPQSLLIDKPAVLNRELVRTYLALSSSRHLIEYTEIASNAS
jgi:hypothetical protein